MVNRHAMTASSVLQLTMSLKILPSSMIRASRILPVPRDEREAEPLPLVRQAGEPLLATVADPGARLHLPIPLTPFPMSE